MWVEGERKLRADDRLRILEVVDRVNRLARPEQVPGILDLFHLHATLEYGGEVARDREQIGRLLGSVLAWDPPHGLYRFYDVVQGRGDFARAVTMEVLLAPKGEPDVVGAREVRDLLRRGEGRWRISQRRVVVDRTFRLA